MVAGQRRSELGSGSGGSARFVLEALLLTVLGFLPVFLVGALSVQINRDFDVGPAVLGLTTALFFLCAGVLATPAGRVVQRFTVQRSWTLTTTTSAVSLAVLAASPSYAVFVTGLVIGGVGNALSQPTANRILSQTVDGSRLGLAFGLKQGAVPGATLLAGLAVPSIALTVGWRWAFVAGAVLAVLAVAVPGWFRGESFSRGVDPARSRDTGLPKLAFLLLTLGVGFGAAASTAIAVFFVSSSVSVGLGAGTSGLVFAGCSLLGLLTRVGLGWLVDHRPQVRAYVLVANLMTIGSLGYLLLAANHEVVFIIGALVAFGAGWTWTGVFEFALVRDHRLSAAKASGSAQTGLLLGAAAGPVVFGVIAETQSQSAAWIIMGTLSLVAGLLVYVGSARVSTGR
jgi:MFS family permease